MSDDQNRAAIRMVFEFVKPRFEAMVGGWVDDPEAALAEASDRFDGMIPTLAYADNPAHPMAPALFFTACNLAMYLPLRDRGVDVHAFGSAVLKNLADEPLPEVDPFADLDGFKAAGEESLDNARAGEFVFEVVTEGDGFDWGMNVKSCGVCHLFSKHDAMDLVPYMCATDDLFSAEAGDGLRRTGTIALGAHQCDFRYQPGGEPLPLAGQYPQRIQIRPSA